MNWYSHILANYPGVILLAVSVIAGTCVVVSFTAEKLPAFDDPQLGFETRGTELSRRAAAWENLIEATRPSGPLTTNPIEEKYIAEQRQKDLLKRRKPKRKNKEKKKRKKKKRVQSEYGLVKNSTVALNATNFVDHPEEDLEQEKWDDLEELETSGHVEHIGDQHNHDHFSTDGFFCAKIQPDYAHIVFKSRSEDNLFTAEAVRSMCSIEDAVLRGDGFNHLCETSKPGKCCPSWSVGNYVALLANKTSCHDITEEDVNSTLHLLRFCMPFYHKVLLPNDCEENLHRSCHHIPRNCTQHNAVYNILHYLTDDSFMHAKGDSGHLKYAMTFLPIAKSSGALDWYLDVEKKSFTDGLTEMIAMDLGLKNVLFNECLVRDSLLILGAAVCIFIFMWAYTASLFVTMMSVIGIAFSLGISYFLYTFVFNIKFFPFVNVLAAVVAVGIGADGTYIFCKVWQTAKADKNSGTLCKLVNDTVHHATLALFVTSATTAAAFYASAVSSVTAIRCFSIFAGTSIFANFLFMITWVPSSIIVAEKCSLSSCWNYISGSRVGQFFWKADVVVSSWTRTFFEKAVSVAVLKLNFVWILLFGALAVICSSAVFYYPKLRLPDSDQFQLFSSKHPFERYDLYLKKYFRFEARHGDMEYKLPLRFVWGVKAADNGNYFDPSSRGILELDPTFNIAAPASQVWMKRFCTDLRQQAFYQPTLGPLLPNCFLETFRSFMDRRCRDPIDNIDRSPCCESSIFPYSEDVFNVCLQKATGYLYETSLEFFLPGVAGPKFSKETGKVLAMVVEYESNYSYSLSYTEMHQFYEQVESWMQGQLVDAPTGLRRGWFISHLGFYDLQNSLATETVLAIGLAVVATFIVLLLTTLDIIVSALAVVTVSFTIFVTVASLVIIGWKLNVLESVAVTVAIGLAVDFPLHYGVQYRLAQQENRKTNVAFSLAKIGSPIAMAAITTLLAGIFVLPSAVLAYIQVGSFIVILTTTSWVYSTLFLTSLLSVVGPERGYGQLHFPKISCCRKSPDDRVDKTIYSESNVSASSVVVSHSESHELEPLKAARRRPRSVSLTVAVTDSSAPRKVSLPAIVGEVVEMASSSATTILLSDELEMDEELTADCDIIHENSHVDLNAEPGVYF